MSQVAEQIKPVEEAKVDETDASEAQEEVKVQPKPEKQVAQKQVAQKSPRRRVARRVNPQSNVVSINRARPQTAKPKLVYDMHQELPKYYNRQAPLPTLGQYDHRSLFQKLFDNVRANPLYWAGGVTLLGTAVWYFWLRKK